MPTFMPVHIFAASFSNEDEAMEFAEPTYDEDGDAECALWSAIGYHTDGDFVETIHGDGRYDYLRSMLADPANADRARSMDDPLNNTLFLVYSGTGINEGIEPENGDGEVTFLATFDSKLR